MTDMHAEQSLEAFSNETITYEEKYKDIEDIPIDLEENNTALQLLLWDNLVVDDGILTSLQGNFSKTN